MSVITDINNNLIAIRSGLLLALIEDIVNDNLEFIEDLQTQQLEQGLDGDGNLITPKYRNPAYARLKQFMNSKPPFGTPDLKATGSFHRRIKARLSGKIITLESSDQKAADLLAKYGEAILQLNEESLEILRQDLILPELLIKLPVLILTT